MRTTALAVFFGLAATLSASVAEARHWRPYCPPRIHHRHYVPGAVVGLGIAGAVLGTIAVVDSIIRPRPVIVAAPPPPPPPYPYYGAAYRRGYEAGRWDAAYGRGYPYPY
jgi:hypothetical protein